jgi:probable rRNA maturation factor
VGLFFSAAAMGNAWRFALIPRVNIEISPATKSDALFERALRFALGSGKAEVSLRLLKAPAMRALNKAALGHDYATDVLSFDHGQTPEGRLLEIVVCPEVAKREAKTRGIPSEQELARYVVHGALHLMGHDDHEEMAREKMWREQERILKRLFGRRYAEENPTTAPRRAR